MEKELAGGIGLQGAFAGFPSAPSADGAAPAAFPRADACGGGSATVVAP